MFFPLFFEKHVPPHPAFLRGNLLERLDETVQLVPFSAYEVSSGLGPHFASPLRLPMGPSFLPLASLSRSPERVPEKD